MFQSLKNLKISRLLLLSLSGVWASILGNNRLRQLRIRLLDVNGIFQPFFIIKHKRVLPSIATATAGLPRSSNPSDYGRGTASAGRTGWNIHEELPDTFGSVSQSKRWLPCLPDECPDRGRRPRRRSRWWRCGGAAVPSKDRCRSRSPWDEPGRGHSGEPSVWDSRWHFLAGDRALRAIDNYFSSSAATPLS